MTLFFIIPLAIVLLAVYIYKNSADEIAYLAASISGVGLILSLILAPWQLKLLLLVVVLLTTTKIWWPGNQLEDSNSSELSSAISRSDSLTENSQTEESTASDKVFTPWVKRIYRGVNYDNNSPALKVSEGEVKGRYRGQVWKSARLETPTVNQPTFELQYRGATLNAQKAPTFEVAVMEQDKKSPASIESK